VRRRLETTGIRFALVLGGLELVGGLVHDVLLRSPTSVLSVEGHASVWRLASDVLLVGAVTCFFLAMVVGGHRQLAFFLVGLAGLLLFVGESTSLGGRFPGPLAVAIGLCAAGAALLGAFADVARSVTVVLVTAGALFAVALVIDGVTPKRLDDWGRSTRPVVASAVIEESLESVAAGLLATASIALLAARIARRPRRLEA
jgi:hypothetical protein